jgi:hypothetical protein
MGPRDEIRRRVNRSWPSWMRVGHPSAGASLTRPTEQRALSRAPRSLRPRPASSTTFDLRARQEVGLGRKNYLFVGDVAAGKSLAGLYSLVATNPFDYLVDVLTRVQDHPASAVDELLPGAWAAAE